MICRICKKYKDTDELVINHTTPVKVHYKDICKSCSSEKNKVVSSLKKTNRYPEDDYICPICNREANKYYLDHNWESKNFRGWLCNGCNVALGLFKDDINILKNAIKYLDKDSSIV